jgi:hypothetical protein
VQLALHSGQLGKQSGMVSRRQADAIQNASNLIDIATDSGQLPQKHGVSGQCPQPSWLSAQPSLYCVGTVNTLPQPVAK